MVMQQQRRVFKVAFVFIRYRILGKDNYVSYCEAISHFSRYYRYSTTITHVYLDMQMSNFPFATTGCALSLHGCSYFSSKMFKLLLAISWLVLLLLLLLLWSLGRVIFVVVLYRFCFCLSRLICFCCTYFLSCKAEVNGITKLR